MKKKIISFVLAALLICCIPACAYAESAVNDARNGVVKIFEFVYVNGENVGWFSGSGFFVGKKNDPASYLITNHHVVEDYLELGRGESITNDGKTYIRVVLEVALNSETFIEAYVMDYNETQDIALLKLEKPAEGRKTLPLKVPTDKMVGESMYVIGYPGTNEYINTTTVFDTGDSIVAKGTIGRLITESGSGTRWISSSDIDVHHGNSGGPVVDEDGSVIGVACKGYLNEDIENMDYLVNIEAVIEMLNRNQVAYYTPGIAANLFGGAKTPVIIAVAAVAAAAVAAVAVIIVLKSKSARHSTRAASGTSTVSQPAIPARQHRAYVRSLSAQHNGKKVSVGPREITIGRKPDCDIIFKEKTPGVSGRHCAVVWDEATESFKLKDLGSTYGTFLESGMKLEPNRKYRLKPGDRFYLGEKANMIRVEVE